MAKSLFLFAPGAGAPSSHPWMRAWADRLATIGKVQTFDYDYMREGRKRPDRLPELIAAQRAALASARATHDGPVVLAGKSMGSRIGCHVSLQERVDALICFGYPLCGGGDPTKLRDKVLRKITTPILFVQGTRDPLCPLDLLAPVRAAMSAVNELHLVQGGDHSLAVLKRDLKAREETQEDVDGRILQAVRQFLDQVL
ncbi:MAG: alpha/beta hydrolase family protein [Chthoniobacterales bacterium]